MLLACAPHAVDTVRKGKQRRAKVDFKAFNDAKLKIRKLAMGAGIDFKPTKTGYPHFYYIDDKATTGVFELSGQRIRQVLDYVASSDLSALKKGKTQVIQLRLLKELSKVC